MPQIFNNPYKNIDTWSAQGAIVMWSTNSKASAEKGSSSKAIPLYMTGIEMQYGRQQQQLYPIATDSSGSSTKVIINGAPNGTLRITGIYSPTAQSLEDFIKAVSKECKTTKDSVNIVIRPFGNLKCSTSLESVEKEAAKSAKEPHGELHLKGLELASIGLTIQGGEVAIVNLPLVFTFTGLDWKF